MKLTVLQENLTKGVGGVSRVVRASDKLPILSHVLLQATKEGLWLSATDMELSVTVRLGAKVTEEGVFAVPSRVFGEFVTSLSSGKVEIETQKDTLVLASFGNTARFQGLPAQEFPHVSLKGQEPLFSIKEEDFQTLERVVLAAATDESRPVLTGVQVKKEDKRVRLVATDGYRLSMQWVQASFSKGKAKLEQDWVKIVPARAIMEVLQFIKIFKYQGELQVEKAKEGGQIIFSFGEVTMVSRLLEGEFPPFEQILPKTNESSILIDYGEFLKAVRLAAIFARESAHIIRITLEKNVLKLEADSPQVGGNTSLVEAKIEGEKGKIAFNSRYLLDFLSVLEGMKEKKQPQIKLELSGRLAPGLFTVLGVGDFKHVIMPVRISEEK
ncbi:MAG: DNA polymerase III subunit beta [Candidatus Chisholmbacteria bacterium]|nr:DNA polymerase III subunit beta [Candidatus Chisholmbacteria bacterium]